jgi:hypothetical protein
MAKNDEKMRSEEYIIQGEEEPRVVRRARTTAVDTGQVAEEPRTEQVAKMVRVILDAIENDRVGAFSVQELVVTTGIVVGRHLAAVGAEPVQFERLSQRCADEFGCAVGATLETEELAEAEEKKAKKHDSD